MNKAQILELLTEVSDDDEIFVHMQWEGSDGTICSRFQLVTGGDVIENHQGTSLVFEAIESEEEHEHHDYKLAG